MVARVSFTRSELWERHSSIPEHRAEHMWKEWDTVRKDNGSYKKKSHHRQLKVNGSDAWTTSRRPWTPTQAYELKAKKQIVFHHGSSVHRRKEATKYMIRGELEWDCLQVDVDGFLQNCLCSIMIMTGKPISEPLSTALHGKRPNEVVHIAFLSSKNKKGSNMKHLLITKNAFMSYS